MFIHRLKIELQENRIPAILWIITLLVIIYTALTSWNANMEFPTQIDASESRPKEGLSVFIFLFLLIPLPFVTTAFTFKRDDLKDPRSFWNTRPVRPAALHGTKFLFLHLLFTLPLALATFIISLTPAGLGLALLYAAEAALWSTAAIHLTALSSLNYKGWPTILILPALATIGFSLSFIPIAFLKFRLENDEAQLVSNVLLLIPILTLLCIIGGLILIKKPHHRIPAFLAPIAGIFTFLIFALTSWGPTLGDQKTITLDTYQPSQPIAAHDYYGSSNHNGQNYHLIVFPLDNLLKDIPGHPYRLKDFSIQTTLVDDITTPFNTHIRNSGRSSRFPLNNKLEQSPNDNHFTPYIDISIPLPPTTLPIRKIDYTDIPTIPITLTGELKIYSCETRETIRTAPSQSASQQYPLNKISYYPNQNPSQLASISHRTFALPLLTHHGRRDIYDRHKSSSEHAQILSHRTTNKWIPLKDTSDTYHSSLFGQTRINFYRNPLNTHLAQKRWKNSNFTKNNPNLPDFPTWYRDTDVITRASHNTNIITIPFEITLTLPNPDIIIQRHSTPKK